MPLELLAVLELLLAEVELLAELELLDELELLAEVELELVAELALLVELELDGEPPPPAPLDEVVLAELELVLDVETPPAPPPDEFPLAELEVEVTLLDELPVDPPIPRPWLPLAQWTLEPTRHEAKAVKTTVRGRRSRMGIIVIFDVVEGARKEKPPFSQRHRRSEQGLRPVSCRPPSSCEARKTHQRTLEMGLTAPGSVLPHGPKT
jgi:hypothetical protein